MTIVELIHQLKKYKQDTQVFVSRDEEGNGFMPLDRPELGGRTREGDIWDLDDPCLKKEDFDIVVVLWP